MITTYERIKHRVKRAGKCLCGKRVVMVSVFEQTINPFNKNEKGEIKTRDEIWKELKAEGDKWKSEPAHHVELSYWSQPNELRETNKRILSCGEQITKP